MKYGVTVLLVLAVIAGAAIVFFPWNKNEIDVVHPVRGPAVQVVYATGTVEASVMVPIAPRNAGRITALLADEGRHVQKGQILAQLEDSDLQKALSELEVRAALAEREYNRKAGLVKKGAVSKESADAALAERDATRAAADRAKAELDFMKLVAPEEGLIIRRDGEAGEFIPANQPVFWLARNKAYRIEAEVDEEDIALVVPDQKVLISADAFPGKTFNGAVQSITPKGDPVARSYRVRIGLAADTPLMIGMTAETNIVIRENKNALLVPGGAVQGGQIWTLQESRLVPVKVETGAKTPQAVEITGGIDENVLIAADADAAAKAEGNISPSLKDWRGP